MLDETLLDDPEGLARADTRGLLLGVAAAGARVRTAARLAQEAGIGELKPDGRPRSVLVAGPGAATAATVAELLAALGSGSAPVLPLRPTGPAPYDLHWTLPGWAGPLDLLLIASPMGTEAGLADLIEQAYRRGCTAAAVVPDGSPIAEAIAQVRGLVLPYAAAPEPGASDAADPDEDLGAFWALLTPLLALGDRIGLLPAPADAIESVADRLDEVAARCGPAIATYSNPAKALASELAESLPVLWSEGPVSAVAARRFAATIASRAGRPALHGELPEAVDTHGALLAGALAGALDPDDFFRDRVEEPEDLRLRVVLLHRPGNGDQAPASSSAAVAREFTTTHDTPLSELAAAPDSTPLEAAVELLAVTDFASVYLAVTSAGRS
ncbi:SIS domain-containing protein [Streptomyces sp. NPDC088354]|uniref:SIS domain-containing protein n=1 Tax=unclassified Streptomyces TaxID=2593676 RepID=UPI0029BC388F|nr:SIS domain-containing protein [Streptomyces sp. MI02-7b]MDX3074760.1 SIS domain-containing protein [Streptomyces sp. MI02-7b]